MKKNETITVTYYIHNKYIHNLSINKNKIDRFFIFSYTVTEIHSLFDINKHVGVNVWRGYEVIEYPHPRVGVVSSVVKVNPVRHDKRRLRIIRIVAICLRLLF